MIDQKTDRLKLPLPNVDNFLEDDVVRIRDSLEILDKAATVDNNGVIVSSQLPTDLAYLDANRKIPVENLPAIALSEPFPVDTVDDMLALDADVGDVALFNDNSASFILVQLPPSILGNWKELVSTQVRSVNGRTGNVKVAEAGENNDITKLKALSGPLTLGGDAQADYDAVTLKQLRAASGGAGGASMNGVMNNNLGAVEWFNGTRAKIWPGRAASDGQLVKRADYPDLWAAVSAGVFLSTDDATWQSTPTIRGMYSTGDGSTTFRLPDLNGVWTHPTDSALNSIPGLFLRGDGGTEGRTTGYIRPSAAPAITGYMGWVVAAKEGAAENDRGATTSAVRWGGRSGTTRVTVQNTNPGSSGMYDISFDASRANMAYGLDNTTEVRPNSVKGIWVIRVSGSFTAASTNFNVINGDTAVPASGTQVLGGDVVSSYQVAGADYLLARFRARGTINGSASAKVAELVVEDRSGSSPVSKSFAFGLDGSLALLGGSLRMRDATSTAEANIGVNASNTAEVIVNRTNGLTQWNWNGTNLTGVGKLIMAGPLTVNSVIEATASSPSNPGNNSFLNAAGLKSTLLGRGPYADSRGAYCVLYQQEYVGNYNQAILNLNGFGSDKNWWFRQTGELWGPNGLINGSGSDIRLKKNVTPAKGGAGERIDQIGVVEFEWIESGRKERGWIAQQLDPIDDLYTEVGGEGNDENGEKFDILNAKDRAIMADMVVCIQELRQQVKDMAAEIATLKGANGGASQ